MSTKEKILNSTIYSIKFKLILAVVIVQILSSQIGQAINIGISSSRHALEGIGVDTRVFDGTIGVLVASILSIIVTVFIIVFIYDRLVLKRLKKVLAFTEKLGNGDLSDELKFTGKDEITRLGNSLNKANSNIKSLISDITKISNTINTSSYELLASTESSAHSIDSINSTSAVLSDEALGLMNATEKANLSLQEILRTTNFLLDKVKEAFNASKEMDTRASEMKKKVSYSLEHANITYKEKQEKILKAIEAGKIVEEIKVMSDTIKEISDQTNLLALNASIEASRAGEQGRGFGVVAEEIKKLAEQSTDAISNIEELVTQVREVFSNLSISSQDVLHYLNTNVKDDYVLLLQTGDQYENDAKLINHISSELTSSAKMMNSSIDKISKVIDVVVDMSDKTSQSTKEINQSLSKINTIMEEANSSIEHQVDLSNSLEKSTNRFTL
jgi:methyl-accepting chemotaxis protein